MVITGDGWVGGGYEAERTKKVKIRTKFLAVDEAFMAMFQPTPGFKETSQLLVLNRGTLISASTIPHCVH